MIIGPLQQQKTIKAVLACQNSETANQILSYLSQQQKINQLEQEIYRKDAQEIKIYFEMIITILKSLDNRIQLGKSENNHSTFVKFLKILIHLVGVLESKINYRHMRDIIYIFISKITGTKLSQALEQQAKIRQIVLFNFVRFTDSNIEQLCNSLLLFVIEWVDLENFQQALILIYYIVNCKAKIQEPMLLSFNWLVRKSLINSRQYHKSFSEFVKFLTRSILLQIQGMSDLNIYVIKLYANLMTLIVKHAKTNEDYQFIQKRLSSFNLMQLLYNFHYQFQNEKDYYEGRKLLNQQKQDLFITLWQFYINNDCGKLKSLIMNIIQTQTTTLMIYNCWSIFNADLYELTIENLERAAKLLEYLQQANKGNKKRCVMSKRGSWISSSIQSRPVVFILKLQLSHPRDRCNLQTEVILRIELERGCFSLMVRYLKLPKNGSKLGYEFYLKKQSRDGKQEQEITYDIQSSFVTFILEFRNDYIINIWSQKSKLKQAHQKDYGRPKSVLIGVRSHQKSYKSGVHCVYGFNIMQQTTFQQYSLTKMSLPETIRTQGQTNTKNSIKKQSITYELKRQAPKQKINLLNEIQGSKNKNMKNLNYQNLQILNERNYKQMVSHFGGKQKLSSYILNGLQKIKEDSILKKFIGVMCRQYKIFKISQSDFYQISFIHGFSLFMSKPINIAYALSQIVCPISLQQQQNYSQNNINKYLLTVQLILNTLLNHPDDKLKSKDRLIQFVRQSFRNIKNVCKDRALSYIKELRMNLSFFIWNYVKDIRIVHTQLQKKTSQTQAKQKDSRQYKLNERQFRKPRPQMINNFTQAILQIHRQLVKIFKQDKLDKSIFENTLAYLRLILIILSDASLQNQAFDSDQIITILQLCYQILLLYGTQLAQIKIISQDDRQLMCKLLSQMYNLLPVLVTLKQLPKDEQKQQGTPQQYVYQVYSSSWHRDLLLKQNRSLILMSKFFYLCFEIGSYCLKQMKDGFLSYMSYLHKFFNDNLDFYSWEDHTRTLTIKDKIMITQLYASCWKMIVGRKNCRGEKKVYTFDTSTKIQITQKLNTLSLPLFSLSLKEENIIQCILQFYISSQQFEFPVHVLSNIQARDLEKILKNVKQKLDKDNKDKESRVKRYICLINIANSYNRKMNIQFISSQQQFHQIQVKSKLEWFITYSKIKQINEWYRQSIQQKLFSNDDSIQYQSPVQVLKLRLAQVKQKLTSQQKYQKIKLIINNFLNLIKDQQESTGLQKIKSLQNYQKDGKFVLQLLMDEGQNINLQHSGKRKKSRSMDSTISNFRIQIPEQQNHYFRTERSQIQKFIQMTGEQIQLYSLGKISEMVAKLTLYSCSNQFLQMHSKLAKSKTNNLIGFYRMIDKLSLEQKISKYGNSTKYNHYNYYILDDYLGSDNVKVMLKKDLISVFNNFISGQMPRLDQYSHSSHSNLYVNYAIKIAQSLSDLNKNRFFQIYYQYNSLKKPQHKSDGNFVCYAYLITKSKIYQGKIQIDSEIIRFIQNNIIDKQVYKKLYAINSQERTYQQISVSRRIVNIQISNIDYSQAKKYLQKFPSLQIYTQNLSYFFAFQSRQDRDNFLKKSTIQNRSQNDNKQLVNQVRQKWERKWISNFQFLITLNNIAGRSLNDVSQYYIFPWTVNNFKGNMNQQFLNNQKNFRRLQCSIGTLNPKKLQIILDKYGKSLLQQEQIGEKPHMFGSFYSNSGIVCNYLLRVNPFTTHHYQLQGKRFDLYDRLFTSIQSQYRSVYSSTNDNRQLLPEFYCAPQFFRNRNKINFAHNPRKDKLDLRMQMPEWVITQSPEQFVLRMRRALQSDVVSRSLCSWIDLIFGYKSQLQKAAQYNNLYLHNLYRSKQLPKTKQLKSGQRQALEDQIQVKANMIKQYGQVPKNIFGDKPSVSKLSSYPQIQQSILDKQVLKVPFNQQKAMDHANIKFDYNQYILAISNKNYLVIINTIEQIGKAKQTLDQQIQAISILPIKKSKYFLVFTVSVSGKLFLLTVRRSNKGLLILSRKQQYKVQLKKNFYPLYQFSLIKSMNRVVVLAEGNNLKIVKIINTTAKNSSSRNLQQIINNQKTEQKVCMKESGHLFIHKSKITNLESYAGLDIFVSIDESGLVNVFSFVPELSIRATFKISYLKAAQIINKIIIHSIGLIVILTNLRQLLVYNIYGDIIQRVKFENHGITDIAFWDSSSTSDILVSTRLGTLHQLDLFDMLKKGQNSVEGLPIQLSKQNKKFVKVNQKAHNKIVMNRFGKYWRVFIISSFNQIYRIQSIKQFNEQYATRKFLTTCNLNNQYKNN